MRSLITVIVIILGACCHSFGASDVPMYHVFELSFEGSPVRTMDSPVRDVLLETTWSHENGTSIRLFGFWDGDGEGGAGGSIYKVRFCPTMTGEWKLSSVRSNDQKLNGQHQGMTLLCTASGHSGFWEVDEESAGGRWYRRSDGSHPYIVGNTMYSYLSETYRGEPSGSDIEKDTRECARYYNKLRFAITGDINPHPTAKPFLDEKGQPTSDGNYSHRPNPEWFSRRVDLAVQSAFEEDMIADIIINSVDSKEGRSVLRPGENDGDYTPILRYMAARYGSYPNVWFCLSNEYNIRDPRFTEAEIAEIGKKLKSFLGYPTPLSVHPNQQDWDVRLNADPPWNDHIIIQNKIKYLWLAADKINLNYYKGDKKPVINDELAYEGAGDGWLEGDVLEAFLGAFLGGGYGSTGYKSGHKLGQYFGGNFNAANHKASDNLRWLRQQIEADIEFWEMEPFTIFFSRKDGTAMGMLRNVDYEFRMMQNGNDAFVVASSGPHQGVVAQLPGGMWDIKIYDLVNMNAGMIGEGISGTFEFDIPGSRAVFLHMKKRF